MVRAALRLDELLTQQLINEGILFNDLNLDLPQRGLGGDGRPSHVVQRRDPRECSQRPMSSQRSKGGSGLCFTYSVVVVWREVICSCRRQRGARLPFCHGRPMVWSNGLGYHVPLCESYRYLDIFSRADLDVNVRRHNKCPMTYLAGSKYLMAAFPIYSIGHSSRRTGTHNSRPLNEAPTSRFILAPNPKEDRPSCRSPRSTWRAVIKLE
jgi:hypothetical protein